MDVKKILEEIKAGRITVEEAEERLKDTQSWTITGVFGRALRRRYFVRENRTNIWYRSIRNLQRKMGRFWGQGRPESSTSW